MKNSDTVKNVIIVILILIIVCGGLFFVSSDSSKTNNKSSSNSTDIESLAQEESNNVSKDQMKDFNEISFSTYMDMYNGSVLSLVLIGRPTCHYCQIAEPILKNISYKYNVTINYLNTDNLSEDDQADLVRSNDYFKDFGTPTILVVSNGEIKNKIEGLYTSDGYIKFLKNNNFISE